MHKNITLENLCNGEAAAQFGHELVKIVKNINDLNTSPTKSRTLTMKLEFKPDKTREVASVDISFNTTLAHPKPASTTVYFGVDGEKVAITEKDTKQTYFNLANNIVDIEVTND